MYDKKENAVISKAKENDPLAVRIHCDDCHGTGITGVDECSSCYGFGFYSICGTRDNPFPRKDD
jgi:RecJ-like exonuclease